MFKYVSTHYSLFVVVSLLAFAVSEKNAEAKIFTVGGKVLAQTQGITPQAGLEASNLRLQFADFRNADLTDADFAGSDLRRADFTGANLDGANFVGADLRGAKFAKTNLEGTNFSASDLRGAIGFTFGRDTVTRNTILPNGAIWNLTLNEGETLVIRNYDAVRDVKYDGTITLVESARINGGKIVFVVDNQTWNSVVQAAEGVKPSFVNVEVHFDAAHNLVSPDRTRIQPFSWNGSSELRFAKTTFADSFGVNALLVASK